jgi:hypothetical protein
MTEVFITIDTELASGLHRRGVSLAVNLDRSIHARCAEGDFGLSYQARRLEEAGLKAVFFLDPMPALIFGTEFLKPIVEEVLTRGHEVQLHLHTEWLDMIDKPPVASRGRHIGQFDEAEQVSLIACAAELLCAAGAPEPVAFRAGNFGADDRTLRALHRLGIRYDSSFNPAFGDAQCRISLGRDQVVPVMHENVLELPVSCISDWPGHIRPAQLVALSAWEMRSAVSHAVATGQPALTIVSHSFELIERGPQRPRWGVVRRFDALCQTLAARRHEAPTRVFAEVSEGALLQTAAPARLPPNPVRSALRMISQLPSRA